MAGNEDNSSTAGAGSFAERHAAPIASAAKRGRNPRFPYVPVIVRKRIAPPFNNGRRDTEQVKGRAYATRQEAVGYAQSVIDWRANRAIAKAMDSVRIKLGA